MEERAERPEKVMLEEFYRPPEEIREAIYDTYDKLIRWRSLRDQPYKQFNSQTLIDYISEARQKFWGYIPLSFDTDTPQFFFPETRNQIIGILSRIANLKLKPIFEGTEGFDLVTATILKDFFNFWGRKASRKIQDFWQFLYCIINGTVIVFTAYDSKIRNVRTITEHDPHTGKTKYKGEKLDDSDVEEQIVYLEDLFVPKIWEPDIQEQEELIWRTLIKWSDFRRAFSGYEDHEYVVPGSRFADNSIFQDFLAYDVKGGDFVEVIKYFNKAKDQYMIIANGVLLNPIKTGDGEEDQEIAPLPWNHKELPFAKTVFEPLDATFFYGIPLAMKVKSPQDALNKMWELLLDREQRSVAAPIITNDPSVEFGLEFRAGRIYQVQSDVNQYREMGVAPASSSYWNALTTLQGIISRTGSGGVGPVLPSRQPRSATEKGQEARAQQQTNGLYDLFYQDLLEQKVWLVIQNMIQFYTSSTTEKILGERKFHKILSLLDIQLSTGGLGNREIRITDKPVSSKELQRECYLRSILRKERVEIIEATPDALRQLKFDIKVRFEEEDSPESERLIYLDYLKTIWTLFGQSGLISQKKSLFRVAEKFGENISDIVEDNVLADYERERFGVTTVKTPPGGTPAVEGAKQQVRGQMFGAQGPAARMGMPQ